MSEISTAGRMFRFVGSTLGTSILATIMFAPLIDVLAPDLHDAILTPLTPASVVFSLAMFGFGCAVAYRSVKLTDARIKRGEANAYDS